MDFKENHSLRLLNSWKIGGNAEYFCSPESIDDCKTAHQWAKDNKKDITYLGLGSNVLISDDGIPGLVICTRKLKSIEVKEQSEKDLLQIECLAGTGKMELLKVFLKYNLSPALMFAGIPGDIGGGIAMNAGIAEKIEPREFCEVIEWVEVLRDNEIKRFSNTDLEWSYRICKGWQPGMIVKAGIAWPLSQSDPDIKQKVRTANKNRLTKQPLDKPSCGSVFVNPLPHYSGQLIEELGLKGHQIGDAQISEKHANFIVNLGEAKAQDVKALIDLVKTKVKSEKNIDLKTEVRFLGNWN